MRTITVVLLSLFVLTACIPATTAVPATTSVATTATVPAAPATTIAPPTATPSPTATPAAEWGIAFAEVDPRALEGGGADRPMTLYVIHSNGNDLRMIADNMQSVTDLTASSDGHELLFSAGLEDTDNDNYASGFDLPHLYRMNIQSGEIFTLTGGSTTMEWAPSWSPDGKRIAFASAEVNASSYMYVTEFHTFLYVINQDGSGKTRIIQQDGDIRSVVWSPTGEQILFTQNDAIWVVNSDGSELLRVTDAMMEDYGPHTTQPVWSPDGCWIAFTMAGIGEDHNSDIYIIKPDGSEMSNLTSHASEDFQPMWAPDGNHIAFVTGREGNWSIYVTSVGDSNDVQEIFSSPIGSALQPAWSVDGSQIAFVAGKGEGMKEYLHIKNLNNTDASQLSELTVGDRPVWVTLPSR